MLCFPCLNDGQMVGRMVSTPALTIFNGQAVCLKHLNTMRGLPAELPLGALPSTVPFAPVATADPVAAPAPLAAAPAAAQKDPEPDHHEHCHDCDNYADYHFQPDVPHCSCGKALVDGVCESQLNSDDLEKVLGY